MKVLFFARDPGGANTIIPVLKRMQKEQEVICYGKDAAFFRMKQNGILCKDIKEALSEITERSIYQFLESLDVDALVTGTSINDFTERYLWKAAEKMGIFSVAIQDQWMNLGIRFSKYTYAEKEIYEKEKIFEYLPSKICIMDELGKEMLMQEGMEESRISVTGQPHFDTVKERYNSINLQNDREIFTVIYVSEPIVQDYDFGDEEHLYWGFNEHTIYHHLIECLERISSEFEKQIKVIIRPHPRENLTYWENLEKNHTDIDISFDCKTETFELLKRAEVVCGMSSMFLLEANICEIPIISMMIGLKRENPFVLDKIGLCKSVLDKEALYEKMKNIVLGNRNTASFKIVEHAAENVINMILDTGK